MTGDARPIAATYFTAWKGRDFQTLRSILSDDATFRGPLGTAEDADECVAALRGMAQMLTDIDIQKVFADESDVLTWFELHAENAPLAPTANWMHVPRDLGCCRHAPHCRQALRFRDVTVRAQIDIARGSLGISIG